jgi:hypothetical protein
MRAKLVELSKQVYDDIRGAVGNDLVDSLLKEVAAARK